MNGASRLVEERRPLGAMAVELASDTTMPEFSEKYQLDHRKPFGVRVYLAEFEELDPLAIPWKDVRKSPDSFPDLHVAKVSSVRTVIGFDYRLGNGESRRIYLKRSLVRGRVKQLISRFRGSKEWREFRRAREFRDAGITVPQPVYYSEGISEKGTAITFFATLAFDGAWQAIRQLFRDQSGFGPEWRSLARFTRRIHEMQILHSDYRSDHIYLHREMFENGASPAWGLIDLDGSHLGRPISRRERIRAMCQLTESLLTSGLEERHVAEFLELYDPNNRYHLDAGEIYETAFRKQMSKMG